MNEIAVQRGLQASLTSFQLLDTKPTRVTWVDPSKATWIAPRLSVIKSAPSSPNERKRALCLRLFSSSSLNAAPPEKASSPQRSCGSWGFSFCLSCDSQEDGSTPDALVRKMSNAFRLDPTCLQMVIYDSLHPFIGLKTISPCFIPICEPSRPGFHRTRRKGSCTRVRQR